MKRSPFFPAAFLFLAVSGRHLLFANQFLPLGGFGKEDFVSVAEAVSADGSTVVGWSQHGEAFRWTVAEGIRLLQPIANPETLQSFALKVSSDGKVIAGHLNRGHLTEVFRWTQDDGIVGLGFLPTAPPAHHSESHLTAVSPNGNFIYGSSRSSDGHSQVFRWSIESGMEPFPLMLSVDAISADGSVLVGTHGTPNFTAEAYRWTDATGAVGLGDLPGGSVFSAAAAISADGQTVVGISSSSASSNEAFRWTVDTGIQALGDLAGGIYESWATAVSSSGDVVLGLSSTGPNRSAFIWDTVHGMRELSQVLVQQHDLESQLTGWHLYDVVGISDDGRTIAGNGTNPDGNAEAWLVRLDHPIGIPEPSSSALLLAAVPFLAHALRRTATTL